MTRDSERRADEREGRWRKRDRRIDRSYSGRRKLIRFYIIRDEWRHIFGSSYQLYIYYTIVMFCPFIRKIHDNEIKLHWTSEDGERAIISFFHCLIRNNSNLVNIFCLGLQYLRFTLEMYIIPFERVYCSCDRMSPCDRLLVVL